MTRSTSPAISSDGTRGWAEEAVILIEVYAVKGHPVAVIQSGSAGGEPHSPLHLISLSISGLPVTPVWPSHHIGGHTVINPVKHPLLAGNHGA